MLLPAAKREAAEIAKVTVKQITQELGYFPSNAVKEALKGGVPVESISQAERLLAARWYERVANEVVRYEGGCRQSLKPGSC